MTSGCALVSGASREGVRGPVGAGVAATREPTEQGTTTDRGGGAGFQNPRDPPPVGPTTGVSTNSHRTSVSISTARSPAPRNSGTATVGRLDMNRRLSTLHLSAWVSAAMVVALTAACGGVGQAPVGGADTPRVAGPSVSRVKVPPVREKFDSFHADETTGFARDFANAVRSTRIRQARFGAYKTAALPLSYAGQRTASLPGRCWT
jgi:hypothetical protein